MVLGWGQLILWAGCVSWAPFGLPFSSPSCKMWSLLGRGGAVAGLCEGTGTGPFHSVLSWLQVPHWTALGRWAALSMSPWPGRL